MNNALIFSHVSLLSTLFRLRLRRARGLTPTCFDV